MAGQGDYLLFLDADGATSINHLDLVWPKFKDGAQVVIASRQGADNPDANIQKPQNWFKRTLGQSGNILIQALAVPGIHDTQCGFKAFTKKAVKDIIPKIKTKGWAFDVEILSRARRLGHTITAIPATWVNGPKSTVKYWHYLRTLAELIKIKYYLIRQK